jgi:cytochrome P450
VLQIVRWLRHPIEMMEDSRARYGDAFTFRFPGVPPLVVFADQAAIKDLFTGSPDQLHASEANAILEPFLGRSSLLLMDGARHRRERRLLMPPFHGERMKVYGTVMRALADEAIDAWPLGRAFPIHPEMQRITLEVILRTVFGLDEGPELNALRRCLAEGAALVTDNPYLMMSWLQRDLGPLTAWRRILRVREEADRILFAEFARRRAEGASGRQDILALLLEARDEDGRPMTDVELRDEMVTLLLAGHETTATTLAWVLHRILTHPDVLARLREEVLRVGGGGAVAPERIHELVLLDATIKESQRVMPIIPMVGRGVMAPLRIGEWDLPPGVIAACCIYLAHHDPVVWAEPTRFDPDRFLEAKPSPYEFFPFGGGTRHCIGAAFASYEMKIVLAEILVRTELRAAAGYQARIVRRGITFAPSAGMPLVVERRAA